MAFDLEIEEDLKQQLARELCAILDGHSQINAGAILRVHQSEMSHLRNGHLRRFSIARLVRYISQQKYDVEIHLKAIPRPYAAPRRKPAVTVTRYDRYGQPAR